MDAKNFKEYYEGGLQGYSKKIKGLFIIITIFSHMAIGKTHEGKILAYNLQLILGKKTNERA